MPTENKPSESLLALANGAGSKPYPDRLCHIDYTAHPHRCGCLSGDDEAQRRFDEHERDIKKMQAEVESLHRKADATGWSAEKEQASEGALRRAKDCAMRCTQVRVVFHPLFPTGGLFNERSTTT